MSGRVGLPLTVSALLLAGCASFSPDGGMGDVASAVSRETGKDVAKLDSAEEMQRARERVAALIAQGSTSIEDVACVDTSFPTFWTLLDQLRAS